MADLQSKIEELWARRSELTVGDADATAAVHEAIDLLDTGQGRVAEVDSATGDVVVHQWLKQAILLLFTLSEMETIDVGPFEYADKIPLKRDYAAQGRRVVPGASARWGSQRQPRHGHRRRTSWPGIALGRRRHPESEHPRHRCRDGR